MVYDVFDSNEVLETKLLAGSTGYDLVVPTGFFLGRQIQAGIFQPLDKSKIPNWKNLDPELMSQVAKYDPGNEHAVDLPVGHHRARLQRRQGQGAAARRARRFLGAAVRSRERREARRLRDHGAGCAQRGDRLAPCAIWARTPTARTRRCWRRRAALLEKVRPYIRKFHSSEDINALANGDICLALMWSGDAGIARTRAEEAKNGVNIRYIVPKEGALQWSDMMAMPADAPNPDNAYAFIDYLLEPEVMAKISNFVTYPNAVPASDPLIDEAVKADPNLFPTPEMRAKLFTITPFDQKAQRDLDPALDQAGDRRLSTEARRRGR